MNKQLKDLMKRAGKARIQAQQRELDRKFFAWVENTFNINHYEKYHSNGKPIAIVDNALAFIRASSEEMSAVVHSKCSVCRSEAHDVGVVRNLEELGERLSLDEQGNFPDFCRYFLFKQPQTPDSVLFSKNIEAIN